MCAGLLAAGSGARADGVTAYLPLNLEPEIERQVERVLILADEPILKRPIAVSLVQLALPAACVKDADLCRQVKTYLERYEKDYAVTHASVTGTIHSGANGIVPNAYGEPNKSSYDVSVQGYVQPNDYFLASVGGIGYSGRGQPTGTMLSMGFNFAQLDVGYRPHWLSPMTDSSMQVSTEAPTMLSATLSNYEPLGFLGFQYEAFLARMSESDRIHYLGQTNPAIGRGTPRLFGLALSVEPFPGWSLGVSRTLQYGGAGLPGSANFLFKDFFRPAGASQALGNQQASYVSRFIFPSKVPFAFYVEYAGEDNSNGGSYLLGNVANNVGIDFPRLGRYFDATLEFSEWQNSWYNNSVFNDGRIYDGVILGHWGAQQRIFNDNDGARSAMLRVGWTPPFGGYLEEKFRYLVNQNYGLADYKHYMDFTLRYSRPWNQLTVGGEAMVGRDVFGASYTRLSGFVRYGGPAHTRTYVDEEADEAKPDTTRTELFVDAGVQANRVHTDLEVGLPQTWSKTDFGPHLGLGARRAVSDHNDLGVRLEFDTAQGHWLAGVRPVDWRYRFGEHFALGAFLGVARYDLATPAYSLYGGLGAQWRNVLPGWDLGADFKYAQNVARDHVLPTDPQGVRPDSFYKIENLVFYVARHF